MSQVFRGLGSRNNEINARVDGSSGFSAEEHLARLVGDGEDRLVPQSGTRPETRDPRPFQRLRGETDPGIFFQDLFLIGQQAEAKQDLQLAATVFSYVSENAVDENLRKKASARLGGMTGQGGTVAGRLEHLSRSWMDQAFDPSALVGMSAAGLAFQSGKLFTMARLWGKAAPQGIRIGGALGGFAVEVPTFVAATKGASVALGRDVDGSWEAWQNELTSGAIVLGALKLSGFAAGSGINQLHGVNPVTGQASRFAHWLPTTRTLGTQSGMLGGIMAGHSLEAAYFGNESPEGLNNLVDSLATLLQFNVAGKLTPIMAPRTHALTQQLGAETHRLSQSRPSLLQSHVPGPMSLVPSHLTPALAAPSSFSPGTKVFSPIVQMSATEGPLGGSKGKPSPGTAKENSQPSAPRRRPFMAHPAPRAKVLSLPEELARDLEIYFRYLTLEGQTQNSSDAADPLAVKAAIGRVRKQKEVLRDALIGRGTEDFTAGQYDALAKLLGDRETQVLTDRDMKKVLVANRGEIALRIIRALNEVGIKPYVTHSESDAPLSWVARARQLGASLWNLKGIKASESYAVIDKILHAVKFLKVDGVHPGYGFLSENPRFARALAKTGTVLLGPSAKTMEMAGDKDRAKQIFQQSGVPVVPGTERGHTEADDLVGEIESNPLLKYPLRLKAVGGGGGRGQATVHSEAELRAEFPGLSKMALDNFGNGAIMAELYVPRFLHVEHQIIADRFGNVVDLGERECTHQDPRVSQKLLEFNPAPETLHGKFPGLKDRMTEATLRAARAVGYTGHGTAEFMVNPDSGEFYIMEINTRIQVEHRVTELVTGVDIVAEQIRISRGLPLSVRQSDVRDQGAALQIRLKSLTGGKVDRFFIKGTEDFSRLEREGIFVEATAVSGDPINPYMDPMFAKILVTGKDRAEVIDRAIHVLEYTELEGSQGFQSDLPRQLALLKTEALRMGYYDNRFVSEWVRMGGENRATYPKVRHLKVHQNGETPLYLEVGSFESLSHENALKIRRAFKRLLEANEGNRFALKGPLAQLVRREGELRQLLTQHTPDHTLSAWAQVDNAGNLRQMVLFEGDSPKRIFYSRAGETVDEVLYEVEFPQPGAKPLVKIHPFDRKSSQLAETIVLEESPPGEKPNEEYGRHVKVSDDGHQIDVYGTRIQLIPTGSKMAVEVRDLVGNYLLSLSPQELIRAPGERLLALINLVAGENGSEILHNRAEQQIPELIRDLAKMKPDQGERLEAIDLLGHTPHSLIQTLAERILESDSVPERHFLDEIQAMREIEGYDRRHRMEGYTPLNGDFALVHFTETLADGSELPRLMIRAFPQRGEVPTETLGKALAYLKFAYQREKGLSEGELQGHRPQEPLSNVIQILTRRGTPVDDRLLHLMLQAQIESATGNFSTEALNLKRITLMRQKPGEYPNYLTYRPEKDGAGERVGSFTEDTRFRDLHPMLAHLIELRRWQNFSVTRDLTHSDRMVHLFDVKNQRAKDHRLAGLALVPRAEVQRKGTGLLKGIPAVAERFEQVVRAMEASLQAYPPKARPAWNRIFVNIQPILATTPGEITRYLIRLAENHQGALDRMNLEKVIFKVRVKDPLIPEGFQTALIRLYNPTGMGYEADYDPVTQDSVNTPIRPMTPQEHREMRARRKGIWVYRIPQMIGRVAQDFWEQTHPGDSAERAEVEGRKKPSTFVELELDPQTPKNDRTGQVDYNQAQLVLATDGAGKSRPLGGNRAGIVVGVQTDDLGIGRPVERIVMMGDLTHGSNGAMTPEEAARIVAAIRLAEKRRIPIDWYTASVGAGIKSGGVENLDASAATLREIIQQANPKGVPINPVVMDVNIGIQSYNNSEAAIIDNSRGVLIMVRGRGNQALTGPAAWTAVFTKVHSEDLRDKTKEYYPNGLEDLAGYDSVHGPNGEAMAGVSDVTEATRLLLRHHYFTYAYNGEMVGPRPLGIEDPLGRDITRELATDGRTVGEHLEDLLKGFRADGEGIIRALHDKGAPEPVFWYPDANGTNGAKPANGKEVTWPFGTKIATIQMGRQPTLVILAPPNSLTPLDSKIISKILKKTSGRLPFLIGGNIKGFFPDPKSMRDHQLEYGAEIGRALTETQSPGNVVNMGMIIGGTKVVFSKELNPNLRAWALPGAKEQVIGGSAATQLVMAGDIRRMIDRGEKLMGELEDRMGKLKEDHFPNERTLLKNFWNAMNTLVGTRRRLQKAASNPSGKDQGNLETDVRLARNEAISAAEALQAAEYDQIHDTQRALEMGAIDGIVRPADLRPTLISSQEAVLREVKKAKADAVSAEVFQSLQRGLREFVQNPNGVYWGEFKLAVSQLSGGKDTQVKALEDMAYLIQETLKSIRGEDPEGSSDPSSTPPADPGVTPPPQGSD